MVFGASTPSGVLAGDDVLLAGSLSISTERASCRSQMYSITYWITSNLDNFLFLGMNGTRSRNLEMYICISSFSTSLRLDTRPDATPDVPLTVVLAFIVVSFLGISNDRSVSNMNDRNGLLRGCRDEIKRMRDIYIYSFKNVWAILKSNTK